MTVLITLFTPDGARLEYRDAKIESQLLPDLTFTGMDDRGKTVRVCTSLQYLIQTEAPVAG